MQLSKEEDARKKIANGCLVQLENSVTQDNLMMRTVILVMEFPVCTSQPLKIFIFSRGKQCVCTFIISSSCPSKACVILSKYFSRAWLTSGRELEDAEPEILRITVMSLCFLRSGQTVKT